MIVVDASLAAKWVLWEADSPAALTFLTTHRGDIAGPDLLFMEVSSAIVRRGNINKALGPDALRALEKWTRSWGGQVVKSHRATAPRLLASGRLALDLGCQIYDCVYLALAVEMDSDLATCDAQFAARAVTVWPRVRLLAEYAE